MIDINWCLYLIANTHSIFVKASEPIWDDRLSILVAI